MGCLMGVVALAVGVPMFLGLDIAFTSLFAYFGIEGWQFFAAVGAGLGLLGALASDEEGCFKWLRVPLFCALEGCILWQLRPDGVIYCVLLAALYAWLADRFDWG